MARVSPPAANAERAVWGRWIIANVAGEMIGFGLAAVVGGVLALMMRGLQGVAAASIGVLGVLLISLIEGSAVGQAQWLVLREALPRVSHRAWLLATVAGAVLAWGAGMMLGTAIGETASLPDSPVTTALGAVVIGVVAGVLLSAVQWLVLRRALAHAVWWVPAHAGAWAFGMVVAFFGMSFIESETPTVIIAAIGASTGLFMGAVVAAITGAALVWMCRADARTQLSQRRSLS